MVNKAVVGVIGVILIATLGVGALVGLQGGGGPADDGNGANGNGPAGTATAAPNGTTGNGTMTNATTPDDGATATPAPQYDVSLTRSDFTRSEIEENISAELNDWRASEGVDPLQTGGSTTINSLRAMARDHSNAMAAVEEVTQEIENSTTRRRYQRANLYDRCSYIPPDKSYLTQPGSPDVEKFEWVAGTEVDTTFTRDEGIRFHENESAVASRLVDQWRGHEALQDGLLSDHYEPAGIGVNVSSDGTVYATVALCGP